MDADKLNSLEGFVTEIDDEGPPTEERQKEQQAEIDLEAGAREWASIAFMVGGGLSMLVPELKAIYTEDACMGWGRSVMPVADKYGWNGPGNIPEIGLALSTIGLAVPTALLVRQKLAQMKADREKTDAAAARPKPAMVDRPLDGVMDTGPTDGS